MSRAARAAFPAALFLLAAAALPAAAEGPELSGSVETRVEGSAGADGAARLSFGFEEYANLRLRTKVGERGTVFAAANLIAASGRLLPPEWALSATSFVAGESYAAAIELERLYARIEGEGADFEAGLMRLAFGYGQAWSPSDFLNPRNPLLPEARPRGVLGAAASAYPSETARLKAFAVAGADPLASDGEGALFGASADIHGAKASLQALYAFETPSAGSPWGVHRAGLSLKLEAEAGIALDALYALDGREAQGLAGLAASAGLDYSFLDGDLYALCQYLYRGEAALDPQDALAREDHLYAALRYRVDDYTGATLSCVACLDDLSSSPALELEHEPFQGLALSLRCRAYLDGRSRTGGGELGPAGAGSYASVTMRAKLRL